MLRDANCSYEQISEFLLEYRQVKICKNTICEFYNKLLKEAEKIPAPTFDPKYIKPKNENEIKITQPQKELNKEPMKEITKKETNKTRKRYIPPPPKPITDEDFLNLCDDDQIIYCYYLFLAEDEKEAERLMHLPGIDSISRSIYRTKKRELYVRCHMKESQYEPEGN